MISTVTLTPTLLLVTVQLERQATRRTTRTLDTVRQRAQATLHTVLLARLSGRLIYNKNTQMDTPLYKAHP